jgi:hypothetical protein
MNLRTVWLGVVVVGVSMLITGQVVSQDQPTAAEAEAMKKWKEIGATGEHHRHLDMFVGKWQTRGKSWWLDPNHPMESEGTSEVKWILDGKFLMEETKGMLFGETFEGLGITGYDNFRKQYTSVWVDSMGTAIYLYTGYCNPSGTEFCYYGTMDDPETGQQNKPYKFTDRVINKDKHVMEMHDLTRLDGQSKIVEVTYTRVK